jgi:hypothetical protein
MTRLIVSLLLYVLAAPVWAQGLPTEKLSLSFTESVSNKYGLFGELYTETGEQTIVVDPMDNGRVAVSICGSQGWCTMSIQTGLIRAETWLSLEKEVADALPPQAWAEHPEAIKITVPEGVDTPFFPLEDGKVVSWVEQWRSAEFNADYQMTVTQSCCSEKTLAAATSDELWEITMKYSQVGVQMVDSGETNMLFDPALGWNVSYSTISRWQDVTDDKVSITIFLSELVSAN